MQSVFTYMLPETTWQPPSMTELPSWRDAKRVAVDFETCDPDLDELGPGAQRGAYIVGVGFSIEDHGRAFYLPMRHEGGNNLDADRVLDYVRDQARDFGGELVCANAQYEYAFAEAAGINFRPSRWLDPTVLEPQLDELQYTYNLDDILKRRDLPGKYEDVLQHAAAAHRLHPKKDLWRLDAKYVGEYGERDCTGVLELLRRQEREVEEQDLWGVWRLETKLVPILAAMRSRGVRINLDKVDALEAKAWGIVDEMMAFVSRETGHQLSRSDVDRAAALAPALRALGLAVPMTNPEEKNPLTKAKPKPSIGKPFFLDYADTVDADGNVVPGMAAHRHHVPAVAALWRARRWVKLTQFCQSRKRYAVWHGDEWRIHPTFKQCVREDDADYAPGKQPGKNVEGTRFGRMAASDPNIQQEPTRDYEYGDLWRSVYEPDRGGQWASADFSQQEPRCWVHYALMDGKRPPLPGAREFAAKWDADPKMSFHKMTAALTGLPVKDAKSCGLGIGYGMGGRKLCEFWLGLPTAMIEDKYRRGRFYEGAGPEGQAIIDAYHAGLPFLKPLIAMLKAAVKQKGYLVLKDADGRRFRFKWSETADYGKPGYEEIHTVLNRASQGRAAHQTKRACVALAESGVPLQSAIHDEFNWTTYDVASAVTAAQLMRDCDPLRVRNRVALEIGADWGTIEEVEVP